MQNSLSPEFASPLVVVAHDAGAANLIIGWLRRRRDIEVLTCLAGPAVDLWTAAFGKPNILQLNDALLSAAALLSGTSYKSDLEHQARAVAKARRILSIGVVDHWVNYHERFVRDGICVLPDQIWVADEDALRIAADCFPGLVIQQHANLYLDDLVAQVWAADLDSHPAKATPRKVLYALEPIRHSWALGGLAGEFQALDYFVYCYRQLGFDQTTEIRLRPHPSDPMGKYDSWLSRHSDWNLIIDPSSSLSQSIAWADTVVGCETYALVIGLAAGRCVLSSLPPHAPWCRLPMKGIFHLRDLPALNNSGRAK